MAGEPRKPDQANEGQAGGAPRTDLPPTKEPYYEGYFGNADEEEKVRNEREIVNDDIPEDEAEKRTPRGEDL